MTIGRMRDVISKEMRDEKNNLHKIKLIIPLIVQVDGWLPSAQEKTRHHVSITTASKIFMWSFVQALCKQKTTRYLIDFPPIQDTTPGHF